MKKIIYTDKAPSAIGAYSQAVEANGMLFISGQIALDPETKKLVEGGITEQTHQVLKNIQTILDAAGYRIDQVVKTTILLRDISHFSVVNQLYSEVFSDHPPARATYAAAGLPMNALLEIETIAVR